MNKVDLPKGFILPDIRRAFLNNDKSNSPLLYLCNATSYSLFAHVHSLKCTFVLILFAVVIQNERNETTA